MARAEIASSKALEGVWIGVDPAPGPDVTVFHSGRCFGKREAMRRAVVDYTLRNPRAVFAYVSADEVHIERPVN